MEEAAFGLWYSGITDVDYMGYRDTPINHIEDKDWSINWPTIYVTI